MRKGLVIGIAVCGLVLILIGPALLISGVIAYETKTVKGPDFESGNATVEHGLFTDTWRYEYTYTFKGIGPGKLEFDIEYDNNLGGLHAEVLDGDGNVIKSMVAGYRLALFRPNYFIYNSTTLSEKGDYTVRIYIADLGAPELFDSDMLFIKVKYKGEHNGYGMFAIVCGPLLIILGGDLLLIALILFIVMVVKNKRKGQARLNIDWEGVKR